jgi:hypothetical protein
LEFVALLFCGIDALGDGPVDACARLFDDGATALEQFVRFPGDGFANVARRIACAIGGFPCACT